MSTAGKNYRSVMDANGDYNTNQMVTSLQDTCESIQESIRTLKIWRSENHTPHYYWLNQSK